MKKKSQFLDNREDISDFLHYIGVQKFTILDDMRVSTREDIHLSNMQLTHLPLRFCVVTGKFDCSNNKLTSLEGAPRLTHEFNCSHNVLESLQHGPKEVKAYDCSYNKLKSLEGVADTFKNVYAELNCSYNELSNLEHCPYLWKLNVSHNRVATLKGITKSVTWLLCSHNNLTNMEHVPSFMEGNLELNHNHIKNMIGMPKTIWGDIILTANPLDLPKLTGFEHSDLHGKIHFSSKDEDLSNFRKEDKSDEVILSIQELKTYLLNREFLEKLHKPEKIQPRKKKI